MSYITVAMFAFVGFAFVAGTLAMAHLMRPSAPNDEKLSTYECGPLPFGDAWRQFNLHYYLFALLFVIFDVEAAFLFPWALAFKENRGMEIYAVGEMLIFVALLFIGWAYAWRRGAMEWE